MAVATRKGGRPGLGRMSQASKIRILTAFLNGFFGDRRKANSWLHYENHLLGGMSPKQMIEMGKINKLFKFVENTLNENRK